MTLKQILDKRALLRMTKATLLICVLLGLLLAAPTGNTQDLLTYRGNQISPKVEAMYTSGLKYLVENQTDSGTWGGAHGTDHGVVGLAVLAMLAHGDDPNHGVYAKNIKLGLNYLVSSANSSNGYIGTTMYNHGFATLALAEAYGSVNDPRLGKALKRAVKLILTVQATNPQGGWRYSPETTSADTTVCGAQFVALIAARNAGIGVPDEAIKKALDFYRRCQGQDGGFGYSGPGGSSAPRSAIGTLVFALAKKKESKEFQSAFRNLQQMSSRRDPSYHHYYLYYAAQAYFHSDSNEWNKWNKANIEQLESEQGDNGSWPGNTGPAFTTSTALLSLAINYRFLPIYER